MVHDAWMELDPNYYNAYKELAEAGKLTIRYRGFDDQSQINGDSEGQAAPAALAETRTIKGQTLPVSFGAQTQPRRMPLSPF